ncbi:MAG: hypothetical protein ACKOFW_08215, partial [Planctomycetaceae bacterium]
MSYIQMDAQARVDRRKNSNRPRLHEESPQSEVGPGWKTDNRRPARSVSRRGDDMFKVAEAATS